MQRRAGAAHENRWQMGLLDRPDNQSSGGRRRRNHFLISHIQRRSCTAQGNTPCAALARGATRFLVSHIYVYKEEAAARNQLIWGTGARAPSAARAPCVPELETPALPALRSYPSRLPSPEALNPCRHSGPWPLLLPRPPRRLPRARAPWPASAACSTPRLWRAMVKSGRGRRRWAQGAA